MLCLHCHQPIRDLGDGQWMHIARECATPEPEPGSAPTDRAGTATTKSPSTDVLYAWQMGSDDEGWNIVGMMMPNGSTLPMITTSFRVAWEGMEIAQAHANRFKVACRLAVFGFDNVQATVLPDDPGN